MERERAHDPIGDSIEQLYGVRDALDGAVHRLHEASAEDIAGSLSSLRTVSLSVLTTYCAFVETLDTKMEDLHAADSHVQTAAEQIHNTCAELQAVTSAAARSQGNIDELRRHETER